MPPAKKNKAESAAAVPPLPDVAWQRVSDDGKSWMDIPAADCDILETGIKVKMPSLTSTEVSYAKGQSVTYDLTKMTETNGALGTCRPIRRLTKGVWEWKDDSGVFVPFYDDDNAMIESTWRRLPFDESGMGSFTTTKLSFNVGFDSKYVFKLQTVPKNGQLLGTQRNEDSGTERELQRNTADIAMAVWDKTNFGIAAMKPPTIPAAVAADESTLNRGSSFTASVLAPPPTWVPQDKPLQFFDVPAGSDEYKAVVGPFMKTLGQPSAKIISLQRIQNEPLWRFYSLTRYAVAMRNKGDAKEKEQLYHGCRVRENLNSIIEFGFDMRVARDGLSGVGIYFALNASYSNCGYVLQNPDKSKEMLICRVAVGTHTQGKHGMKRPPAKKNGELYDSVARLPTMHVVFDNSQAYPEYLIKYIH